VTTAPARPSELTSSNGQSPGLPRYLTLKEAAAICRAGQSTLRAAARRRAIGHTRLGKRLLFTEADLREYLERQRVEADAR
jgi:excisionase family DNA binding protein